MSTSSRRRLVSLVRRHDADLAEAALLVGAEAGDRREVDTTLLRLDAIADGLRTRGFRAGDPDTDARELGRYLAGEHRFTAAAQRDPANVLLDDVLDRRRGRPVTLAILYVAIARRLSVTAFPIALPGLVVVGIGGRERPVVMDPSRGGLLLDQAAITAHVEDATDGRLGFRRSMLRPSPPANVVRRLLNELTQAYLAEGTPADARWAVELKLLLPNRMPDDRRVLGDLLLRTGRFDAAADAYEAYLELVGPDAPDAEEVRRAAIGARARLN